MVVWLSIVATASDPPPVEVCNGVDDDGDGRIDEGPIFVSVDADGDGYGADDQGHLVPDCAAAAGRVSDGSDCDDGDRTVNPAADEACDALDSDCDRTMDEGCPGSVGTEDDHAWMVFDATLAVGPEEAYFTCVGAGWDAVSVGDDQQQEGLLFNLDPFDAPYWLGLVRYPYDWMWIDGTDLSYDNWAPGEPSAYGDCSVIEPDGQWVAVSCDGEAGVACELVCAERWWYVDADGDGYGRPAAPDDECEALDGRPTNGLDCDDGDPTQPAVWYEDRDHDGYGAAAFVDCHPDGAASVGGDCADRDGAVNPGAGDPPGDGVDQDCDGSDGQTSAEGDGDADGDGAFDGVDPAPFDAGGVVASPPAPPGCATSPGGLVACLAFGIGAVLRGRGPR